jgi:hypothetical protein
VEAIDWFTMAMPPTESRNTFADHAEGKVEKILLPMHTQKNAEKRFFVPTKSEVVYVGLNGLLGYHETP